MRKLILSALSAMCLMCSCSNEDGVIPPQKPTGGDDLIGGMEVVDKIDDATLETFDNAIPNVKKIADRVSTTYEEMNMYLSSVSPEAIDQEIVAGYEVKLMKTMDPLVQVGRELCSELIRISNDVNDPFVMDAETLEVVQKLDDVQLIELGMIVSACLTDKEVTWVDGQMVGYQKVVGCLAEALGINDFMDLAETIFGGPASVNFYINGTKALLNAKTLARIAGAMGLRYLGVVGIAYGVYKFGKCMKQ